jgi:hypothetical protein
MKAYTLLKLFAILLVAGTLWMLSATTAQAQMEYCPNWMSVDECRIWVANGMPTTAGGLAIGYRPNPVYAPRHAPMYPVYAPRGNVNLAYRSNYGAIGYSSGYGYGPSLSIAIDRSGYGHRRHSGHRRNNGGHNGGNNGGGNKGGHNNKGGKNR